jgi:nucleotidyltransferase/DNA polymerase involved in DNA repair
LPEMYGIDIQEYVCNLQKQVMDYIWVPVSIWVSTTRIKAKIFSKLLKPQGVFIDLSNSRETFETLPLEIVPFIGRSMQEKLRYNCTNVYDFIEMWYWRLKKILWKSATDLWLELSWVNAFCVKKTFVSQSMSRWRSFNKCLTSDRTFLNWQVLLHFAHLYEKFSDQSYSVKKMSLFFRNKEKVTSICHYVLPESTTDRKKMLSTLEKIFEKLYNPWTIYRSTWVIFWGLKKIQAEQLNLFSDCQNNHNKNAQLISTLNSLNKRYNTHKVTFWFHMLWEKYHAQLWIRK